MNTFAIDIGNRRAKLALVSDQDEIIHRLHIPTAEVAEQSESIRQTAKEHRVKDIVIASVVPTATDVVSEILSDYDPLVVTGETPTELTIEYTPPNSLGADRLAAAAGAYHLYGKVLKRTIMVVDAGTTITADLVGYGGAFLGGAIFPGEGMALDALSRGACQLPEIEYVPLQAVIGSSTIECMLIGVRSTVVGSIENLYKRYGDIRGENPFMLLTGASAAWIAPELSVPHMVDPDIVLIGLAAIRSYNRK